MPDSEPERRQDEAWWERELNRNEKLMDKYMAAFGENPDKFKHPRDLYNKVHFDIDPPESAEDEETENEAEETELFESTTEPEPPDEEDEPSEAVSDEIAALNEAANAAFEFEDDDDDPKETEDYPAIAKVALKFAVDVMRMEEIPEDTEVLYLSAGKVGANLAGGNGLGYDEDMICGNIVKCRWALADCEFCREMLGHLQERTGNARFGELCRDAEQLSVLIRDRIARLRKRVWW